MANASKKKTAERKGLTDLETILQSAGVELEEKTKGGGELPQYFVRVTTPTISMLASFDKPTQPINVTDRGDVGVSVSISTTEKPKLRRYGTIDLPTGVNAIIGAATSGKSTLLRYLSGAADLIGDRDQGFPVRRIAALEPWEDVHPDTLIADTSSEAWKALLIALAQRAKFIAIDSLSFAAFTTWPHYSTLEKGFNPGFFFWLTSLNNAAIKLGATVLVAFNPTSSRSDTITGLVEILTGRVSGVMTVADTGNGISVVQSYRALDGVRTPKNHTVPYQRRTVDPLASLEEDISSDTSYEVRGQSDRTLFPGRS